MHSSSAASSALVEYSDVSSEDFSDPEAGEIDSDAALAGRKPDNQNQTRKPSADSLRITKSNDYRYAYYYYYLNNYKCFVFVFCRKRRTEETEDLASVTAVGLSRQVSVVASSSSSRLNIATVSEKSIRSSKEKEEQLQWDRELYMSSDSIDTDELEAEMKRQKRKKLKKDKHKHKSKKKSKKRKKKRAKSYSSIDSLSDNNLNSLLDRHRRYTPPTAPNRVEGAERTVSAALPPYTPHKDTQSSPLSAGTPPTRRPNSNNTYYSEAAVATPGTPLGSSLQVTVTNKTNSNSRHRSPARVGVGGTSQRYATSPRTPPQSGHSHSVAGSTRDSRGSRYVQSPLKDDLNVHHRSGANTYSGRYSAAGSVGTDQRSSLDARKLKRISPGKLSLQNAASIISYTGLFYFIMNK